LTAGRDVPGGSEVRQKGEGTSIMLSGEAVKGCTADGRHGA